MNSGESTFRNIAWGPSLIGALGGVLFLLGGARFIGRHHFDFTDALYCCLAVVPAGLWLLVLAYVIQHARLVSLIPLIVAGVLVFSFPVFDVAFGLALMGAIAGPALSEWKNDNRMRKSTTPHGGQGKPCGGSDLRPRAPSFCDEGDSSSQQKGGR